MKSVTIKSIYGKTLAFKDFALDSGDRSGRVEVVARDDEGVHKLGMVFNKDQVDALRDALAVSTPAKSDVGVFFVLRQRVGADLKVKVCYAGCTDTKIYTSRARAQAAAVSNNRQHGDKWTYFVVEKETV